MKLSVIIPARNEAHRIETTLRHVNSYLENQSYDYEIVVMVNDSHDGTLELINYLAVDTISKMKAVDLQKGGKGNAVTQGVMYYANGDIIIFMDADNATPISEIEKFFPHLNQGYEIVIGSRYLDSTLIKKPQPVHRIILGRLSNKLIQVLVVPEILDTQLGFKAFTQKSAKEIFQHVSITGWSFDMEVLTIGLARGYSIKEVGVSWTEYGGGQLRMSAYFESLRDLLKIKYRSIIGKYEDSSKNQGGVSGKITLRDYDFAGLAGFLAGIFMIPTAWNLGIHSGWIILFPFVGLFASYLVMRLGKVLMEKWLTMLQFCKFALVGVLNVSINFGFLNFISIVTGITGGFLAAGSNIPGTVIAALNSYFWNKFWVFKRNDGTGVFHHLPKFALVVILDIIINSLIIILFTNYLHVPQPLNRTEWLNIAKILATITVLFFNFFGYKLIVFQKNSV